MTVTHVLQDATARLRAAGVPSPDQDAELLLRHVLGWDRARVVTEAGASLRPVDEAQFRTLVDERAGRKPLQHITGRQWFWRHEFLVTPDALIPRPETELIVEAGLDLLRAVRSPLIVDVGTGSGCIALSLAAERPDATVVGVDISPEALQVAAENRKRLGLQASVRLVQGDLLEPVRDLAGRVDLVASNPPYVSEGDALTPEVREHEPAAALFPPSGWRSFYGRLVSGSAALVRPGGFLLLEIGLGMEAEILGLCEAAGFDALRVLSDLQGIPRTIVGRRDAGRA